MMYHVLPKSAHLARYFAPVAILALAPLATPFADNYFPPPDSKGGWRTLTDPAKIAKTAGVDRQKLGLPGLRTIFRPRPPGSDA